MNMGVRMFAVAMGVVALLQLGRHEM
jgi:hypothetical protein